MDCRAPATGTDQRPGRFTHGGGRRDEAIAVLSNALDRHPNNVELLSAAMNVSRALGDRAAALRYAEQLARLAPTERGWLI